MERAYWICTDANPQHEVDLGPDLEHAPFNVALSFPTCRVVAFMIDESLLVFTRFWCLFELLRAVQAGRHIDLCTAELILNR